LGSGVSLLAGCSMLPTKAVELSLVDASE
jgi:hypothetical protein